MHPFLTPSLKITSGEISAKEQQERAEAELLNRTDKKQSSPSADQNHFNRSKASFKKSEITNRPSRSINVPIKPPSTPHHPPGGAHLGRANAPAVLRAPDAPKLKHDKMKQFYMIDMKRKRW